MDQDTTNRVADLIIAGRKIEAIKVVREATGYGLAEAKRMVEEMSAQSRPEQVKNVPADEIENNYNVPVLTHFIASLFDPRVKKAAEAIKLAKQYGLPGNYTFFRTQIMARGDPVRTVEAMKFAKAKNLDVQLKRFVAADLTLMSEERLKAWVNAGMPNFDEFLNQMQ